MSGNGVLNINYSLSGTYGQVTIPAGAASATVTLTDVLAGLQGKTATMTLQSGTGYSVSSPSSASVTCYR